MLLSVLNVLHSVNQCHCAKVNEDLENPTGHCIHVRLQMVNVLLTLKEKNFAITFFSFYSQIAKVNSIMFLGRNLV